MRRLAGTTGWKKLWMRSDGIHIAALLTPEARKLRRKLRHLLYGNKPHVSRVIYEVDEGGQAVSVLTIRHGARRKLKPSDLI